jgi:mono/diheme cytochrome c family protein
VRQPGGVTAVAGVASLALAVLTVVAWSSGGGGDPSPAGSAMVATGANLFRAKGCAVCHDGPGSESSFDVGPDLTELYLVAPSREPGLSIEDYVRRSITSPDDLIVPGFNGEGMSSMPALPLSAAEVEALVAYVLGAG